MAAGRFPLQAAAQPKPDDRLGRFLQSSQEVRGPGDFIDVFATGIDKPENLVFGPDGNLYVSSIETQEVLRYNGTTGAFIDAFVPARSGGLNRPYGIVFGLDGNLYVTSETGLADEVLRYDGTTGAFIDAFVTAGSGGLDGPLDLVFGPDGHLYVLSFRTNEVLRYNGTTGAFIDRFVFGLLNPFELVFGPNGNLYVSNLTDNRVSCQDGTTGRLGVSFRAGIDPDGLAFGPDGNLYVSSSGTHQVLRFDATTGTFIDVFVAPGSGGLEFPHGLTFGPDGNLYVSNRGTSEVLRYEGPSVSTIVTTTSVTGAGSLSQAIQTANFNPDPNTISFAIPGPGPHTIMLDNALPPITQQVIIDGATQGCAAPCIHLQGPGPGAAFAGLDVAANNSTIEGLEISGFDRGLRITGTGNTVQDNHLHANGSGVLIEAGGQDNVITNNVIADNDNTGVIIQGSGTRSNRIHENSIFDNGLLGIDLGEPGVTPNDAGDTDTGPNTLQNFPVLTEVNNTSIAGTLNSRANTTFHLEFFSSPAADASGFGEGQTFLGSTEVTTDGSGDASFSFSTSISFGSFITATATDVLGNNTSEFALALAVTNAAPRVANTIADQQLEAGRDVFTVDLTTVFSDADGDTLAFTAVSSNAGVATAAIAGSLTLTVTPVAVGTATITVTADDGEGGQTVTNFSVLVVTPTNRPPAASQIITPAPGATVVLGGSVGQAPLSPGTPFEVIWTASTDPDGDAVSYRWELSLTQGFSSLLFEEEVGESTQFETTAGVVATALTQAGIPLGAALKVFHRVAASDGLQETVGPVSEVTLVRGVLVGIEEEAEVPEAFALEQNYPNPFNPETVIPFALPETVPVQLVVYDVTSREVARLVDQSLPAGIHAVTWDAKGLPSGIYLYRLTAGSFSRTRRMILLR